MTHDQFDSISERIIDHTFNRAAAKLVLLHGYTAYEAEKIVHGRVTNTAMRDVRRIKETFEFAVNLVKLGDIT